MFKNERQFWFWWTKSLKDWLDTKFASIASALPQEATEAEVDAIFTSSES